MLRILEMTYADLAAFFSEQYGKGSFLAAALYREFYKSLNPRAWTAEVICRSPGLAACLERDWQVNPGRVIDEIEAEGVVKFITELDDGHCIESVIIAMATHRTVCVSSQVGCRMGCRFCETAQMGFVRDLTVQEITGQVYAARRRFGESIRNVVFMGMGEPLDNFDAVAKAVRVLSDQRGLDVALRRITLSTAGLIQGIERMATLNMPGLNLAVSLNSADNAQRTRLMPINRSNPLRALQKILLKVSKRQGPGIMINYVLIPGINDGRDCAQRLSSWLSPLRARVNLIPFNPGPDKKAGDQEIGSQEIRAHELRAPDQAEISVFREHLIQRGVNVQQRYPRGRGLMAACGQLGRCEPAEEAPRHP
ncbi:MAG: 23S rRNA (adenine(2503)-C(2))-methyltransferase RlmN [Deltaproteobacteria bacterium]|nr:23S rRNA (adenine(2503)-C(2))-methyltransferase RlmN [Deltaproteobacteria bacterium]